MQLQKFLSLREITQRSRFFSPDVEDIVRSGLCIGCGLCESVAGSDRVRMSDGAAGGSRPQVMEPLDAQTQATIRAVCPGLRMEQPRAAYGDAPMQDRIWGPAHRLAKGHATDPEVRFRASSGGTLSALATYLIESGEVEFVLHVAMSKSRPLHSKPQLSFDSVQVMEGAGSRYTPSAPLVDFERLLSGGRRFAFIGKPCDVAAVRNLGRHDPRVGELVPYLLSFVCGGVDAGAVRSNLNEHGLVESDLRSFRCRGDGCPGMTRIETNDGRVFEKTYGQFWGETEDAWKVELRCKICPDSVGEQADIVVFDVFPDGEPEPEGPVSERFSVPKGESVSDGFNGMIARTEAGAALLQRAEDAGALKITTPLTFRDLDSFQPHQVRRRRAVAPRLLGVALANGVLPRASGYRLLSSARRAGARTALSNLRGAYRRARSAREAMPGRDSS